MITATPATEQTVEEFIQLMTDTLPRFREGATSLTALIQSRLPVLAELTPGELQELQEVEQETFNQLVARQTQGIFVDGEALFGHIILLHQQTLDLADCLISVSDAILGVQIKALERQAALEAAKEFYETH